MHSMRDEAGNLRYDPNDQDEYRAACRIVDWLAERNPGVSKKLLYLLVTGQDQSRDKEQPRFRYHQQFPHLYPFHQEQITWGTLSEEGCAFLENNSQWKQRESCEL